MASNLDQLRAKAMEVSSFVRMNGATYYKQLLEKNKKYIQEPPIVETCRLLGMQLFYTRLASIPSRYESLWKEVDHVKQMLKRRQELKVEDAGNAALLGLECFALFCVGEVIGRGFRVTGYHV